MMRRANFPFAVALAAAAGLSLAQASAAPSLAVESLRVEGLAFLPLRFGPGEVVELRAFLPTEASLVPVSLKEGEGLPSAEEAGDPEIRELSIQKGSSGWQLRLRFVPWSPGPGFIPSLTVKGFVIPPLSYEAASILAPGLLEPAPPRPQREPPGTALYLYGLAGLVLVLVLGALAAAAYLLPAARRFLARWRAAQAFRRLCRSLDYLTGQAEAADPIHYYAVIARALRLYLAERVEPRAPALTATELSSLPDAAFPSPGIRDEAAALLAEADHIRYAGDIQADGAQRTAALRSAAERARSIGAAAEEALYARL